VVQDFKGKTFINIREYYESNGELKPGKKVRVSVDTEWNTLRLNVS
jgi:hypothetical protein